MSGQYYGFRCYSKDGEALGWLYTYNNDREIAFTKDEFDWCKRWKTERGAKYNFDWYNRQWEFKSKGGYLKIEVMPESLPTPYKHQEKWHLENPDIIKESKAKYDSENPVWSIRLKPEIREWLEKERYTDDGETNAALVNRKLEKLMKLEGQGY